MAANWRDRTLSAVFLLMEATWLYVGLGFVVYAATSGGKTLSWLSSTAILAGAFVAAHFVARLPYRLERLRTLAALVGLAFILVNLQLELGLVRFIVGGSGSFALGLGEARGEVVLLLVMWAAVWWRGTHLARVRRTFDEAFTSFIIGVLVVTFAAIFASGVAFRTVVSAAGLPLFTLGLVTLAISRLEQVGFGKGLSLGAYWVFLVLLAIGVVVLLGILAPALLGVEFWTVPFVVGDALRGLLFLLLYPIFLLVGFLIDMVLGVLIQLLRTRFAGIPPESPPTQLKDVLELRASQGFLPDWAELLLQWALLGLLLVAVCLILAWAFQRWRRSLEHDAVEVRESLWSREAFLQDVLDLLRHLLKRFRPAKARQPETSSAAQLAALVPGGRSLRRLYLEMLETASSRGLPRLHWQTPAEFQGRLEEALGWFETRPITEAFVSSRYGARALGTEELTRLEKLWRTFKLSTTTLQERA